MDFQEDANRYVVAISVINIILYSVYSCNYKMD